MKALLYRYIIRFNRPLRYRIDMIPISQPIMSQIVAHRRQQKTERVQFVET